MLDSEKIKKKKDQGQDDGGNKEILAALQGITKLITEHGERLEELEEGKGKAAAQLRLVNLLYDTDDIHLPGLTRLPLLAVKPFAIGMMLDAVTKAEVRSGKVSLSEVYRRNYFLLMRSVEAEAFNKGIGLAGEQAASEAEKGAEYNLGAD